MTGPLRVSLSTLDLDGVRIAWNEAVAIVQEFCRTARERPSSAVLDARETFVTAAGTLAVESIGTTDPELLVRSIGELLKSYLANSPGPKPLEGIVADALAIPPRFRSVAELSRALEPFERSSRSELIRSVFQHWINPEDPALGITSPEAAVDDLSKLRAVAGPSLLDGASDVDLAADLADFDSESGASPARKPAPVDAIEPQVKPPVRLTFLERVAQRQPIDRSAPPIMERAEPVERVERDDERVDVPPATRTGIAKTTGLGLDTVAPPEDAESVTVKIRKNLKPSAPSLWQQLPQMPSLPRVGARTWSIVMASAAVVVGFVAMTSLMSLDSSRPPQAAAMAPPAGAATAASTPSQQPSLGFVSSTVSRILDWMGTAYVHGSPSDASAAEANGQSRPAEPIVASAPPPAVAASPAVRVKSRPRVASEPLPSQVRLPTMMGFEAPAAAPREKPFTIASARAATPAAVEVVDTAPASATEVAPPPLPGRAVVYSDADADVIPPAPVDRQVLGTVPSGSNEADLMVVEIVINENGNVESARLVSTPATIRDTMVATMNLAAAKTWNFHPALREGHPVKYRRRVWFPAI